MNYEIIAERLTERLEGLQQENTRLRDELASVLDQKYALECQYALSCSDDERLKGRRDQIPEAGGQDRFAELQGKIDGLEQELLFIQGSNFYKIWLRYRRIPEPVRKVFRQFFKPFKRIFRWIKGGK